MDYVLQSENIGELAKALSKAQAVIEDAKKDGLNPHFKSKYATLDSILGAVRGPLSSNDLAISQQIIPDGSGVLCTTLLHISGQWIKSFIPINPTQNTPQGMGSALTYARRYSLAAMVGISQEDDDGEAGSIQAAKLSPVSAKLPSDIEQYSFSQFTNKVRMEIDESLNDDAIKSILKDHLFSWNTSLKSDMFDTLKKYDPSISGGINK